MNIYTYYIKTFSKQMQVLWSADASKTSGLGQLESSSPQEGP